MEWIEPADQNDTSAEIEKHLWATANTLWADADLKPSEYSPIVLGIIFLRYADIKFAAAEAEMKPAENSRSDVLWGVMTSMLLGCFLCLMRLGLILFWSFQRGRR